MMPYVRFDTAQFHAAKPAKAAKPDAAILITCSRCGGLTLHRGAPCLACMAEEVGARRWTATAETTEENGPDRGSA